MNKSYKTFKEWNTLGYKIHKGEKSHKRNKDGDAMFSDNQVYKLEYDFREVDPFAPEIVDAYYGI